MLRPKKESEKVVKFKKKKDLKSISKVGKVERRLKKNGRKFKKKGRTRKT